MTTSGAVSMVYDKINYPYTITTGPDGNLWFTAQIQGEVFRLTPGGHATRFFVGSDCGPDQILSADGFLWVQCDNAGVIYRITTKGAMTPIAIPGGYSVDDLAAAPDGVLWGTDFAHGALIKISGA